MRIAQITDLHLRHHMPGTSAVAQRRSRLMAGLFAQALERIAEQNVDLIALTGDLLDVPTWMYEPSPGFETDDPAPWREAALADYRLIKQLLDATGIPSMVVPGNHDYPALMWQVFDGATHELDCAGHRVIRFCDYEHEGHQAHRYFPDRGRWLDALASSDPRPQVHLQHYVVTPALNKGYPHTYAEGEHMTQKMAESSRVRLSLSGHYHAGTDLIAMGHATFTTGPAFCSPPFAWRVYELGDAGSSEAVTLTQHALGADAAPRQRVVFLDRDGVINDRASYRQGPEVMHLLPGSAAAIRQLNDAGYATVVITNQSCVGMGHVPPAVVASVNDRMCRLLAEEAGAHLTALYCAFDAGEYAVVPAYANRLRCKPAPAMLHEAFTHLGLDTAGAWMVGDTVNDAHAGVAAGAKPILVHTGHGQQQEAEFREAFPDAPVMADLAAAVELILSAAKSD